MDAENYCQCSSTMVVGDSVNCLRCGKIVHSALATRRYEQRLRALGYEQPETPLTGEDAAAIDDLIFLVEWVLRTRRQLYASENTKDLSHLDRSLLPWAKSKHCPKYLVLNEANPQTILAAEQPTARRHRKPRPGALRELRRGWRPNQDQLLEAVRTRISRRKSQKRGGSLPSIVQALSALIDIGAVDRAYRTAVAARENRLRKHVDDVLSQHREAIDVTAELTGLSVRTINAACARANKAAIALKDRESLGKFFGKKVTQ